MNYSFTNYNVTAEGNENNGSNERKASPQQIKFYKDLCNQRGLTPEDVSGWSYNQLDAKIKEIKAHIPVSVGQKELIKKKIANLQSMNVNMKEPDYSTLTGGKDGTASQLISQLIEWEREYYEKAPPSEEQIKFLVQMYLCPDVAFEQFDIKRTVIYDEVNELTGKPYWRYLTPEEFAEEISNKMNRKDASKFIDDNRGTFNTWKSSRIKPEQKKYIRQLEDRLADTEVPKEMHWIIQEDGTPVLQRKEITDKGRLYAPKGYSPLAELELAQMSVEDASRYIDILKSELQRKELYSGASEPEIDPNELRDISEENSIEQEMEKLKQLVHGLESIAGWTSDDLHEAINSLLVEGYDNEALQQNKRNIQGFVRAMIENGDIDFGSLLEFAKENEVMQKVMLGVA